MKKGFTLVELLAVMIIIGLLLIITIPGYMMIYSGIKRNNLNGKITTIESSAKKYGNLIKDDVKKSVNSCLDTDVKTLIEKGYLTSEDEATATIYNPTDNTPLDGIVRICYCTTRFDIEAYYVTAFDAKKVYHVGDYVDDSGILYRCVIDYADGSGINGIHHDKKKGDHKYFEKVKC